MARGNGAFNVWVYAEIRRRSDPGAVSRVLESGLVPGSGSTCCSPPTRR